jgi:ribosomal protein S12 methylthiotransferase accessory factor
MEQKSYKQYYLPIAGARLIEYSRLLEEIFEPAGNYQKPDAAQAVLFSLLVKLSAITENYFGPALAFRAVADNSTPPANWASIINYLKKEGLIKGFYFEAMFNDDPQYFRTFIDTPFNPKVFNSDGRRSSFNVFNHGDSLDAEEAIAKCIGEFLERFPLLLYKEKDFLRSSMNDLDKKGRIFLDINKLAGYSDEQKLANNKRQFNPDSHFFWLGAKSLFRQEEVLTPAQLIFWNYNIDHQGWQEPVLTESNTNGAGGHYNLTQAILAGIYELIQRDGFLIYWLNHQPPPKISTDTIKYQPLRTLLEDCWRLGFEVNFFDTTSDIGIPSCVGCIVDESDIGPRFSLGGGCGADWDKALMRSLMEALSVRHWLRVRQPDPEKNSVTLSLDNGYKPFSDWSFNQAKRMTLWSGKKMLKNFEFFRNGRIVSLAELKKNSHQFAKPEEELNHLIKTFRNLGEDYEILYYQAKHKALNDLNYVSVRVVIPPLLQLYLYEPNAPLGARRIKEVPEKLGFKAAKTLNPLPHPFP